MTPGPSWPTTSGARPLHATPRTPSRPSDGPQVSVIAQALGTPLLPWQQYVADVAGERRPDGSYEYQIVVVSVPRQSGKTTLLHAIGIHRALVLGRDVFYTAQTGKDAGARWYDAVKLLRKAPAFMRQLREKSIRVFMTAGGKRIAFPGDVSYQVFAPTAESLHGYTPPTVMLDEAFAHDEVTGELLMGAIGPAQQTIIDRQLWIVSTAGTALSVFLRKWLDRAIAGTPRVAVFVWALADGEDPFSAEAIEAFHPAVGFKVNGKLMTTDDVLGEAEKNTRAEYERAYCNRWTSTVSHLIPAEVMAELKVEAGPPDRSACVLTYDVAHDRQSASVLATWMREGKPHSKVVMAGPGTSWVAGAIAELRDEWKPAAIAADDGGPTRDVTDQLERAGVPVEKLPARDFATATSAILTRIDEHLVSHAGDQLLLDAVSGLVLRDSADGVVISRRHSVGDVSAAVAWTVGAWILDHAPAAAPKPMVYIPGVAS